MEKLIEVLKTAVARIRSGLLTSEAQVKKSVIEPILSALGWDDSDPTEVALEFPLDGKRADYALLSSDHKPQVFIEAKRLGAADGAGEKQLFDYAVNRGIPLLVLTDGDIWDFYLSMADGVPSERRFYRAELSREENTSSYARHFVDYLRKDRVLSGQARRVAEDRRQSDKEKSKARKAIPGVWREMLSEPEEKLRDLLVGAVESKCGTKPEIDDVEAFLKTASSASVAPASPTPTSPSFAARSPVSPPPFEASAFGSDEKLCGFILDGEKRIVGGIAKTLVEVVKEFQRRDPDFLSRFEHAPGSKGPKRQTVARDLNLLFPNDPGRRAKKTRDLGNGWWIGVDMGEVEVVKKIQIACDVAGVKFGSELTLLYR